MAYKEGVAEILHRVAKLKTRKERVEGLRKWHNTTLEAIVDMCYNPRVQWALPPGSPPYKPLPKAQDGQSTLYANLRRMRIFMKGLGYDNLLPLKRETQFIQFLESLDPDDAILIVSIKEGKMPYKQITRDLFEEAWPALASTWGPKK